MVEFLSQYNPITVGLIASLIADARPASAPFQIFFTRTVPPKLHDGMLGFAAGVMLAATAFSLVVPAIEYGGGGLVGALIAAFGLILGGVFLDTVDQYISHLHFIAGAEGGGGYSALARFGFSYLQLQSTTSPKASRSALALGSGDLSTASPLRSGSAYKTFQKG